MENYIVNKTCCSNPSSNRNKDSVLKILLLKCSCQFLSRYRIGNTQIINFEAGFLSQRVLDVILSFTPSLVWLETELQHRAHHSQKKHGRHKEICTEMERQHVLQPTNRRYGRRERDHLPITSDFAPKHTARTIGHTVIVTGILRSRTNCFTMIACKPSF